MRHLFEGSYYSDSLFAKCGVNSRVVTKWGAASIQANTYGKYSKKLCPTKGHLAFVDFRATTRLSLLCSLFSYA